MSFLSLVRMELKKIRRSGIFWILVMAVVILWVPSVLHADINFQMQAEGISPEHNYLIQGFLGMSWFLFPAVLAVGTVLLIMTERKNRGILKMLSLPVSTAKLSMAKFVVLLVLMAVQILLLVGGYYISGAVVSEIQDYDFLLPLDFVLGQAVRMFLASIPMASVFWMLAVLIQTPVFSIGIGLVSIVPSVLMINTKAWFLYPMCYPFFVITAEYGKLAQNLETSQVDLIPWIPAAVCITAVCLDLACVGFGKAERR